MTLMVPQNEQKNIVHFDAEKFGRLNKPVVVLRKVNINKLQKRANPQADTAWELIGKGQVQLHLREDALPWYAEGLILTEQPRDEKVSRDIMKATLGFAIARSDTGEILKVYGPNGMNEAIADANSVELTIKPVLQKIAPTEEEDEDAVVNEFLAQHANVIDEAPPAEEA